jgi:tRNA-splicing ligase RtcB
MPIGGVVAYQNFVSPSGVGYDIACGNMAVATSLTTSDIEPADMPKLADEIQRRISFGMGRKNNEPIDSPVFDQIARSPVRQQRGLLQTARNQLGTVGSGNHYVDILEDEDGRFWVGVHFGSRGFGHKTARGFMNIARGRPFDDGRGEGEMDAPPLLLDVNRPSGQDYIAAMQIAGDYAYAGREAVVGKVLQILGTQAIAKVHNHHNFAWRERHGGGVYWVVRKGATPAFPEQEGFVGGSMGDISVILRGL